MKKWIVASFAVSVLTASSALAGLNWTSPGLPSATAYGGAIINNQASAMCVDCHSVNPLAKRSAAKFAWQTSLANFMGSHYVIRDTAASAFDATNTGGGITYGSLAPRTAGQYIMTGNWGGTAGRVSKYANGNSTTRPSTSLALAVQSSTFPTLPANGVHNATVANQATLNASNMICESCHSIISNVAGGKNLLGGDPTLTSGTTGKNSLVGTLAGATGGTDYCEGCHGDMTRAHARGNNSPDLNNHHVVTITTNSADQITNAKAATKLLWTRATAITGGDRTMATSRTYSGQLAEVGYRLLGTWVGGVAGIRAGQFNCTDCHAFGHGGRSDTAGRILRSGQGTEVGYFTNAEAPIRYAIRTYTERLNDIIAETAAPTILQNDQGYCEGCHVYNK